MKVRNLLVQLKSALGLAVLIACAVSISPAQQANTAVPTLVNFTGSLTGVSDKPLSGQERQTIFSIDTEGLRLLIP